MGTPRAMVAADFVTLVKESEEERERGREREKRERVSEREGKGWGRDIGGERGERNSIEITFQTPRCYR